MSALTSITEEVDAFERVPSAGVQWHPYADLFPWIEGAAFDDLKADIAENGVLEPIVFFEGKILDGRNRYMAARDLGIEYPRVEYRGDDPLGYVVSLNLRRRHLTESQRGMVAAKLAKMPVGRPEKAADLPVSPTQAEAATMLAVSERTVRAARKVQEVGVPALVAAVETGVVSVSAAAEVAKLPVEEVQALVDKGPAAVKQAARDVRDHGASRPVIDLKGRDPADFNRAMHFRGMLRDYARELAACDLSDILPRLTDDERNEVRIVIGRIDAAHSSIIERL
jgi:hypothetical protein